VAGAHRFGVVQDRPSLHEAAQFSRLQHEAVRLIIAEMDLGGEQSARADTFANLRKKIALQVEEVANQVVGAGFNRKRAGLKVRHTRFDGQTGLV
jgi:hypothetical protein